MFKGLQCLQQYSNLETRRLFGTWRLIEKILYVQILFNLVGIFLRERNLFTTDQEMLTDYVTRRKIVIQKILR